MLKIKIKETGIKKCENFALKVVETSFDYYSKKRNQNNKEKIKLDHFNGKITELGVWGILTKHFKLKIPPPDFTIYNSFEKSWDKDLGCVSVKNASVFNDTISWVFQNKNNDDNFGKDSILLNPEGIIALAQYIKENNIVKLHYLLKAENILNNNFLKNPINKNLIGIKKCIYKKSLIEKFGDKKYDF